MAPFHGWGSTASRLSHFEEAASFLLEAKPRGDPLKY